jgi:hypothetical protein
MYKCIWLNVEEVRIFVKELLCNLSMLELCSTLKFCTWYVLMFGYDIFKHLVHYDWYKSIDPKILLPQTSHLGIFAITFFGDT